MNFGANVAEGAVGAADGSENEFRTNADGTAVFDAIIAPGPLSINGEAPDYVLDGHSTYLIGGVYHNDDVSYGGVPGPNSLGHFSVEFAVPEPSSIALGVLALIGMAGLSLRSRTVGKH